MSVYSWILFIFVVLVIAIVLLLRWKDVMSFIQPQKWVSVTMLERDNNVVNMLIRKNKSNTFTFNEGVYNLFSRSLLPTGVPIPPLMKFNVVYKEGRLAKLFYVEGNENPISFKEIKETGFPELRREILKMDLRDLWDIGGSLGSKILDEFGIYILIGIVILLVYLIAKVGSAAV